MNALRLLLWLVSLLSLSSFAFAQSARLQNEQVYLGDVATLLIEYDNKIPSLYALDTTQLERDFEILDLQSRTSRLADAGQFTNRMQWEIRLLPRRSGVLTIPPLELGDLQTSALQLRVLPLSSGDAARQTVEIEISAEPLSPLVGQQTNVSVRLTFNTPLLDVYWSEPVIQGASILRGIAESSFSQRRDGEYFDVIERVMAVYPEVQGELDIAPAGLRATIDAARPDDATPGVDGRRRIFRNSSALQLAVRNIPAAYSGRYWLPARELALTQRWEADPEQIRVGDSIGRAITIVARGLPGRALPTGLLNGRSTDYGVYADLATTDHRIDGRDLVGRLEQTFAYIMTRDGEVAIPEVRLKWWDVDAGVERETRLPGRSIRVLPALPGPAAGGSEVTQLIAWLREELVGEIAANPLWLLLAVLVTAALLFAWHARASSMRHWFTDHLRRRRAHQRLHQACRIGNPRQARMALLEWAALRWPDLLTTGLAQIEHRFDSAALGTELSHLDRALYAATATAWDGDGLWRELAAAEAQAKRGRVDAPQRLQALYPQRGH